MKRIVFLAGCLFFALTSVAQKRVKLKQADNLYGSIIDGKRTDRLVGNVVFKQTNTTIFCDSAYFYKTENRIEAFGHIHIIDGDSVDVTSRKLTYDGGRKMAYLRENVVFVKKATATLYTDFLDYDRANNKANYFNGGKLVDSANVLTSRKGYYNLHTNMASFKGEVDGKNKDMHLNSDTLQYHTGTKTIFFRDHTTVVDKEGKTAVYESGVYETQVQQSVLFDGNLESKRYFIKGNKYKLDDKKKVYHIFGKVKMTHKEENTHAYGEEGIYNKRTGVSKIFNKAYSARVQAIGDTLFIAADTMVVIDDPKPDKQRALSYRHVRIFKGDMQGICDSLVYFSKDSTMRLYGHPFLWNEGNQMSADTIRITLKNKKIDKMFLDNKAFVINEDTLKNLNQIKGRNMTAIFREQKIHQVLVDGNGESIYYVLEEPKAKIDSVKNTSLLMGLNKIICSNMKIDFLEGKVYQIRFYIKPEAQFIPPHEIKEKDKFLKGFEWRIQDRPTRKSISE